MRSGPERARRLYLQEESFWSSSLRMGRVGLSLLITEVRLIPTDDKPDPTTMKSFIMTSDKGLSYSAGIWRKFTSASAINCKDTD